MILPKFRFEGRYVTKPGKLGVLQFANDTPPNNTSLPNPIKNERSLKKSHYNLRASYN